MPSSNCPPDLRALSALFRLLPRPYELHSDGFAVGRQMRKQEAPIAVEHLQFRIAVRNDLTQKCVHLHVAAELLTKFALLVLVRERLELHRLRYNPFQFHFPRRHRHGG